jgi:hypothetical protein
MRRHSAFRLLAPRLALFSAPFKRVQLPIVVGGVGAEIVGTKSGPHLAASRDVLLSVQRTGQSGWMHQRKSQGIAGANSTLSYF